MTKLNAEELAAKRYDDGYMHMDDSGRCFDITLRLRECAANTIREVAQPIADERDELRERLSRMEAALRRAQESICCAMEEGVYLGGTAYIDEALSNK